MLARGLRFVKRVAGRSALLAPAAAIVLCLALTAPTRVGPEDRAVAAPRARSGRAVAALVVLTEQADLSGAAAIADNAARAAYVYRELHSVATRSQLSLIRRLAGWQLERFFIVNALWVEAEPAVLTSLANWPEVAVVEPVLPLALDVPARREPNPLLELAPGPGGSVRGERIDITLALPLVRSPGTIQGRRALADSTAGWGTASDLPAVSDGLRAIGAQAAWSGGYQGQGAVVAVLDSGVAWQHPALGSTYRGRSGDHDYSWFDPLNARSEPVDAEGHGTHVAGVAVGRTDERVIGVAPRAEWIACRVALGKTFEPLAALRCLEWSLAPTRLDGSAARPDLAPDVVNLSWSATVGPACHSTWLNRAIASLQAAGIVVVASAGNEGPACSSVCAPAEHEAVLAVGSFDLSSASVDDTSSRGPVNGSGSITVKPDLVAPGVAVESSVPPDRYGRRSGSSMAAPHVTGAVALLLSARPDLRGQDRALRQLLEGTAVRLPADACGPPGAPGKNNRAGYGLLRVDRAVALALAPDATATATPRPSTSGAALCLPRLETGDG